VIRQPELLLTEVTKDKNIFCCRDLFVQPGLVMSSEPERCGYIRQPA
jgi:hypothetical protein